MQELKYSSPEAQGISSGAILDFLDGVETNWFFSQEQEVHSLMILRHGYVVAEGWFEPYKRERKTKLFSMSKSFTSTAVGLAAAEGLFSLEDKIISFFPEEAPANPSPNLAAMNIRHLLSMSTGHAIDVLPFQWEGVTDWVRTFFSRPVEYAPGTFFCYNTGATYMLGALVTKVTGQSLTEFLKPRLFEPLGITDYYWETIPDGLQAAGFGLNLKTEDIARFGQLYLQKGRWGDKQVLPESWAEEASRKHIDTGTNVNSDSESGYAYQFWRCKYPGAYRGDGAYGQNCIIVPEKDAVIVLTSGVTNGWGQPEWDLVWDKLLPGMFDAALPEDDHASAELEYRLARLRCPSPAGVRVPPARLADGGEARYAIEKNELGLKEVAFRFGEDALALELEGAGGSISLRYGYGKRISGEAPFPRYLLYADSFSAWPGDAVPKGAIPYSAGCWQDEEGRLVLELRFTDTPFIFRTVCDTGDRLSMHSSANVSFVPMEERTQIGVRM